MPDDLFRYCPHCATPLVEQVVGGAPRPACPACGFAVFHDPKLVAVVLVAHAGRLLLARRAINPGLGRWSFVSGYVDRGEPVEDAARREVREETGLDVELAGLLGVYSTAGIPQVLIAYHATVRGDPDALVPQWGEVSELAFFAPTALPDLAFPGDTILLRDWCRVTGTPLPPDL